MPLPVSYCPVARIHSLTSTRPLTCTAILARPFTFPLLSFPSFDLWTTMINSSSNHATTLHPSHLVVFTLSWVLTSFANQTSFNNILSYYSCMTSIALARAFAHLRQLRRYLTSEYHKTSIFKLFKAASVLASVTGWQPARWCFYSQMRCFLYLKRSDE